MTSEKKYLCLINMFVTLIFVFYDIFFSIYVYDLSQNLNFVFTYSLFKIFIGFVFKYIAYKLLSPKNCNWFYRSSFVIMLVSILSVFFIEGNLSIVFLSQALYTLASICYYYPHEITTISKNEKQDMPSFLGISTALGLISSVISPFLSGYLADYISYTSLFIIILICAGICFALSFKIKIYIDDEANKIKVNDFTLKVHKIKRIRLTYLGYGLCKLSQDSVLALLLPVFLFLKTGTTFYVGVYSSLVALISGVALLVYVRFNKNKNLSLTILTIISVILPILLTIWTNIVVFFIYYFISQPIKRMIKNRVYDNLFCAFKDTEYSECTKQHHMVFGTYDRIFSIIGFMIAIIIYNCFATTNIIGIIILVISLMQIPSTILINLSEKMQSTPNQEAISK